MLTRFLTALIGAGIFALGVAWGHMLAMKMVNKMMAPMAAPTTPVVTTDVPTKKL